MSQEHPWLVLAEAMKAKGSTSDEVFLALTADGAWPHVADEIIQEVFGS